MAPAMPAVVQAADPVVATGTTITTRSSQPFTADLGTVSGVSSRRHLRATVNWGDEHVSRGFIFVDAAGNLHVSATHTYARGGTYPITVTLLRGGTRPPVQVAQFQSTANVVQSSVTLQPAARQAFTMTVGSFLPPAGLTMPQAIINWGDGTFSRGTIQSGAVGDDVIGTHTYARPGFYRVTAVVTQSNGFSTTRVATLSSFAAVGEIVQSVTGGPSTFQSLLPPG